MEIIFIFRLYSVLSLILFLCVQTCFMHLAFQDMVCLIAEWYFCISESSFSFLCEYYPVCFLVVSVWVLLVKFESVFLWLLKQLILTSGLNLVFGARRFCYCRVEDTVVMQHEYIFVSFVVACVVLCVRVVCFGWQFRWSHIAEAWFVHTIWYLSSLLCCCRSYIFKYISQAYTSEF